jgi:hypothetical protein
MIGKLKNYLNRKGITPKDLIQAFLALGLMTAVSALMVYGLVASLTV